MDYSELLYRCRRVAGVQEDSEINLTGIVTSLAQIPAGTTRHVMAERLAGEMAEWIEAQAHPVTHNRKPH